MLLQIEIWIWCVYECDFQTSQVANMNIMDQNCIVQANSNYTMQGAKTLTA